MRYNTTGTHNVALGVGALATNTTTSYNTALGYRAGYTSNGGANNIWIGADAGYSQTTGVRNVIIGVSAGQNVTDGGDNVFIGYQAGYYTTATTTGDDNVYIGNFAKGSDPNEVKAIALGYNAVAGGSNTFRVVASGGVYNSGNTTAWQTTSDSRIKKNIVNNNTGLDILNQIQVRNFEYRTGEEIIDFDNPGAVKVDKQGLQLGVIAQEIAEVLPEVVKIQSTGVKTVDPDNLTWYLVNAVKELSAKVEELEAKLG